MAKEKIKIKERDEKVNFMKQMVPLFIQSKPNRTTLNRLATESEYIVVTKDCMLINQGSLVKNVYIVIEGEFVITKTKF